MKLIAVDEVKSKRFILCAVTCDISKRNLIYQTLSDLRLPGQTRIHFVDESDRRRKQILGAISKLPIKVQFFVAPDQSDAVARERALGELIMCLPNRGNVEILIEQDENFIRRDRAVIQRGLFQIGRLDQVAYRHVLARQEPLVWLPDVYAWVANRGGSWRGYLGEIEHEFVYLN